jgi:alpha/beta superfamily hydrolase
MTTSSHRVIPSTGGTTLEVLIEQPVPTSEESGTVVVCHPHPTQGGTMTHPILGAIAKKLSSVGFTVVRFNFRGVGESTGTHDDGIGELSDVASVIGMVDDELPPLAGITGWSFGAAMALLWQARSNSTVPYVGIAPPVESALTPNLPEPDDLQPARRMFIVGERDQFVDVPKLNAYAHSIGSEITIYRGSDHFFVFKHERLADDVAEFLAPSS